MLACRDIISWLSSSLANVVSTLLNGFHTWYLCSYNQALFDVSTDAVTRQQVLFINASAGHLNENKFSSSYHDSAEKHTCGAPMAVAVRFWTEASALCKSFSSSLNSSSDWQGSLMVFFADSASWLPLWPAGIAVMFTAATIVSALLLQQSKFDR